MKTYNIHPELRGLSRKEYLYEYLKKKRRIEREITGWKYKKRPELKGLNRKEYEKMYSRMRRANN